MFLVLSLVMSKVSRHQGVMYKAYLHHCVIRKGYPHPLFRLSSPSPVSKTRLQVSKIPRVECQTVSLTFLSIRQTKSADFSKASCLVSSLTNQTCCQSKM